MCDDARGVSDVIGFVFVFSLIVGSVAIVTVVGLGGLQDARDAARVDNTELAFDVLANNIEDGYRRGAPGRGTEIRLGGGGLTTRDPTYVNVTVNGTNTTTRIVEPVVYEFDDTRIVYEATAVIREEPGGAVFVREPSFVLPAASTPNRTAIPMVATDVPDGRTGGQTTVLVRTATDDRRVLNDTVDATVTLEITTTEARAAAWNRYLEGELPGSACSYGGGETVTCTFETSRVVVSSTRVDVEYE